MCIRDSRYTLLYKNLSPTIPRRASWYTHISGTLKLVFFYLTYSLHFCFCSTFQSGLKTILSCLKQIYIISSFFYNMFVYLKRTPYVQNKKYISLWMSYNLLSSSDPWTVVAVQIPSTIGKEVTLCI